jgi:trigger factor
MTEQQAVEEQPFEYAIRIEDAGPATKKVVVDVPKERVQQKLEEQFNDIRSQAAIQGFRPGKAPRKLIEKRFAADIREQVRRSLISESYEQAVQKNSLNVIGEPEFDNPEAIQLNDDTGFSYSFQIEVQPDFTLPELKGIKVRRPKVEVTRPGRAAGVDIPDFDQQLTGLKPGEARDVKAKIPDNHPDERLRGKDVTLSLKLKEIKQLEPVEVDQAFLESLGFQNEKELRDALREQMEQRIGYDVQQSMREQISSFLAENTQIELPAKLSDRQAQRVVTRKQVDLMMRGVAREQATAMVQPLLQGAKDEAVKELKLFFILQKIATDTNVDVDEAELNGRIAMLAAQRGERPEKLKQQMAKDGTLANLYIQMREQRALDLILKDAQIEDVDLQTEKKD